MFFKSLSHHFTLCPYFTICEVLKILNKLHTVAQSTTHSPHSAVILEDVKIYIASSLKTRKVEQAPNSTKSASKSIKCGGSRNMKFVQLFVSVTAFNAM